MKRSTAATAGYAALLLTLGALMPWGARGTAEFGSRAMWAIVASVLAYIIVRYGLDLIAIRSDVQQDAATERPLLRLGSATLGLWRLIKWSCAASLAIGLVGIVLGTSHLTSATGAFLFAALGQQLVFILLEILVARQPIRELKFLHRALALTALVILAVLFAWSSNITLLAQKPSAQPRFSDTMNLMFAIPALLIGLVSLVPWSMVRK
jgi:hypothetical protein